MTVHDVIVFDNQSHKLLIISAASGIGFITFIPPGRRQESDEDKNNPNDPVHPV